MCDSWDTPCPLLSFFDSFFAYAGSPTVLLMLQHHPHEDNDQWSELGPAQVYTSFSGLGVSGEKDVAPCHLLYSKHWVMAELEEA